MLIPRFAIRFLRTTAPLLVLLLVARPVVAAVSENDREFFEKNVRPILIENCYECHGPEKQKGGRRLDSRAATLRGGDSGPALVPGEPDQSVLIRAVRYDDPDFQMPPKNALQKRELQVLTEWVERGAPDPRDETETPKVDSVAKTDHWAYQPINPIVPPASDSSWPRSDIDRFILARLTAEKIAPAEDAAKATLIRRVYYDLIGLPPTPEQIDSFIEDKSAEAFPRLVDELLASPRFGERWGRHWLDIARFAESVTLRGLVFNNAWRYRDYVIESYNRDLPFNQFITEQIAGDLLETSSLEETHRARAATTYLVLGNFNYEEQDKEQLRMDIVDEQLDTIGKGLLGQTVGCARCHDHKFDPIPTRDYYAMAGILRNVKSAEHANVSTWLDLPLPLPPEEEEPLKEHERKVAELNRAIRKQTELIAQHSPGKAATLSNLPGIVVDDAQAKLVGDWQHSTFNKPFLGTGYVHDRNAGKGSKTITFHPELNMAGKYEVRFAYSSGNSRSTRVPITILHAGGETTVHVNQRQPPAIASHFVSLGQFDFEKGNQGYVIVGTGETDGHVTADAIQFLPTDAVDAASSSEKGSNSVVVADLKSNLNELKKELAELTATGPKRPMVMSVQEEPTIEDARIHIRGTVHNLGEKVPRGFLSVASKKIAEDFSFDSKTSGRRELAAWITHPENPLTARVYVNRVWLWLFGTGLVRTPDNFGTTGEAPTHPELLDFLAHKFVTNGWSTKKLVREIVLSRPYALASSANSERDLENRLYSRANRRRLDAESMRDTILAVSGRLDQSSSDGPTFKTGTAADFGYADDSMRRSVYVPAFRNALPQIFELFDFADTSVVTGTRHASIVSPQALYFLNHPFIIENAAAAANRNASGQTRERIIRAYRECLGRAPRDSEIALAEQHLHSEPVEGLARLYQSLFASPEFRFLN